MLTPREICLRLLDTTDRGQEYSNIALDMTLRSSDGLSPVDRRFIAALYYGVLERRLTLDEIIKARSSRRRTGSAPSFGRYFAWGFTS